MSELALQLIAEEKKNKTGRLDLGNCGLTELPKELFELTWLEWLSFGEFHSVENRKQWVQTANSGSQNRVGQALESLAKLRQLKTLYLSDNQIQDASPLAGLTALQFLDLSDNEIHGTSFLTRLSELQTLDLSNNQIQDANGLVGKTDLQSLDLRENHIQDVSFLEGLHGLQALDLSNNHIQDASPLARLTAVRTLDLNDNRIQDASFLTGLNGLEVLGLSFNEISDLTPLIPHLERGIEITLEGYFPEPAIHVGNNPITNPPIEVVMLGREAVLRYFEQVDAYGTAPLFESKLMILGQGGAGKTTLAQLLLDETWEVKKRNDESTLGVVVHRNRSFAHTEIAQQNIRAHLWDFGGQEVQKMLHQFFITQDCLYVIVSDKRAENTNFQYWFQIIELLGPDCPVVVLENPMESKHVNESFALNSYQGQFTRLKLSARKVNLKYIQKKARADWQAFTAELAQHLSALEIVNRPVVRLWSQIRDRLNDLPDKYITPDAYFALVDDLALPENSRKMTKEEALQCLDYLRRLGDLIFFEDNTLSPYIFLDHNWLTHGLYFVLSDQAIEKAKGKFTRKQAYAKWEAQGYNELEKSMLLQLLLKDQFDICYATPGKPDEFITPLLLANDKPGKWPHPAHLTYQYTYPFVPHGLFSRLIVRLNGRIAEEKRWKTGVWLSHTEKGHTTQAEVEYVQHPEEAFEVRICGSPSGCQEMLQFIDHELENLHQDFRNLRVTRKAACVCEQCKRDQASGGKPFYHALENLNGRLAKKKYTVVCQHSHEDVPIGAILQDIYKEEAAKGTQFESIFYTLKELGMSIHQTNQKIEVSPTITTSSQASSDSTAMAKAKTEVSVAVQVKQIMEETNRVKGALQKALDRDLTEKGATKEDLEYALEDIEEFEETLQQAEADATQEVAPSEGAKTRLKGFIDALGNEESPLYKALKAIRKGRDYGVGLARTYNSLATNIGLTPVPELVLKALEKL